MSNCKGHANSYYRFFFHNICLQVPVNLRVCVLMSHRESWVLWILHYGMDWGVTIHFSIEIQLVLAIREQERVMRGERVIGSSVAQRGQWSGHTERQKCSHRPNPQLLIASPYYKGRYFFPPRMTHCRSISLFHSMHTHCRLGLRNIWWLIWMPCF